MTLKAELESDVAEIFRAKWEESDGDVVPDDESVSLANEAIKLQATVLYADLADSTDMVDSHAPFFAAEIYKAYLRCAAKIIRSELGEIAAYDGDRIMAVFVGDRKSSRAVRAAMKINYAVQYVVNPLNEAQYGSQHYLLKHVVGIDASELFVAKTGIRGANDLVWVGPSANYAAKLCALPPSHPTYITKKVYDVISADVKFSDGRDMWETVRWNTLDNRIIYRSNWWWRVP